MLKFSNLKLILRCLASCRHSMEATPLSATGTKLRWQFLLRLSCSSGRFSPGSFHGRGRSLETLNWRLGFWRPFNGDCPKRNSPRNTLHERLSMRVACNTQSRVLRDLSAAPSTRTALSSSSSHRRSAKATGESKITWELSSTWTANKWKFKNCFYSLLKRFSLSLSLLTLHWRQCLLSILFARFTPFVFTRRYQHPLWTSLINH